MRTRRILLALAIPCLAASARPAGAVAPTPDELSAARQWFAAQFKIAAAAPKAEAMLLVVANHDPVIKNSRGGTPLRIRDQPYTRGLYCHALSQVIVRLPGPGAAFSAIAGVDSNEQTSGGRGSVEFSVQVRGAEKFRSGVVREGMAGVPVNVELGGAAEFVLQVDPTPDGISCDQSDWADAKATLQDGRTVWLGDLPLEDAPERLAAATPPFSFTYAGQSSVALLAAWERKHESRALEPRRTEHTLTWSDPRTGLVVRCVAVEHRDFPAVEWTLHFKNAGRTDTPILENVQALNAQFPRGNRALSVLHYADGGFDGPNAYQPHEVALEGENSEQNFSPNGRGSDRFLPFFNLECGEGGVVMAVGWPGQWTARFTREGTVQAGQQQTRFLLHPGEEVRSPLMALLFWKGGDWIRAQNVWRRWMLAHNCPTRDGQPLPPQLAGCSSRFFGEMIGANEENQIQFVDRYVAEKLGIDYWWMDAGWYICNGQWPHTGTWEVDTNRFPRGLRAITDRAHAQGVKSIVWFEPERVTPGTWVWDKHPDWLLGGDGGNRLLNLGNPAAREWLTDHTDKVLTQQGIDLYRQDSNINPLGIWRGSDAPDRQGVTENHYIAGYLAWWDELRRRRPGMLIDSCSSGGRRNDLETLRRAVPLLRSDDIGRPVHEQGHMYGYSFWLPYHGTGTPTDSYHFRSSMTWHVTIGPDARDTNFDYAETRRLIGQWREVAPCYLGDYYPLTPYTLSETAWMAWQFDRPEQVDGMVQAFRREQCGDDTLRVRLRGLQPDVRYRLTDLDTAAVRELSGKELMDAGVTVTLAGMSQAAVITYQRAP